MIKVDEIRDIAYELKQQETQQIKLPICPELSQGTRWIEIKMALNGLWTNNGITTNQMATLLYYFADLLEGIF